MSLFVDRARNSKLDSCTTTASGYDASLKSQWNGMICFGFVCCMLNSKDQMTFAPIAFSLQLGQ